MPVFLFKAIRIEMKMARKSIYSEQEKIAAQRYSSIKSRTKERYDIEKFWTKEDFIRWYINKEKRCCYCGCSEAELSLFWEVNDSKRKTTRGRKLEIERFDDKEYSADNCDLSCYWCNNAKSDVFNVEEFSLIGTAIGTVIKNKIQHAKTKSV